MAKYNVDVEVQAKTSAAERKLDSLAKTLSNLQQVAGKVSETLNTKNAWNAGYKASQDLGNVFDRVAKAGRNAATAISDGLTKALIGITSYQVLALDTNVRGLASHLPLVGKAIAETTTGPFQQFIQSVGSADVGIAALTVGLMAFGPQAVEATFKAAGGLLEVSRKAGRVTKNVLSIIPGFKKVGNAAKQSNGSVINGLEGLQAALRKAQEEQEKFDNSLRGASLKELNDVTREAKKTLEGYWSMTGKAQKAADNYAKALKAQKDEQRQINDLVKKAQQGLPLSKAEQNDARISLANQKEKALSEAEAQKKEWAHERRMRQSETRRRKKRQAERKADDAARRRERLQEGLMLGVGFPLLFGGGPGAILGGGLGAVAQSKMGEGKGFGAQIALSAVGGQIDRLVSTIVKGAMETSKALTTVDGAMELMEQRSLFSTQAIRDQARALQKQGKNTELAALLTKEYTKILGYDGIRQMQELAAETEEAQKQWGILRTQLELLLTGPLTDIMDWINTFLSREVTKKGLEQRFGYFAETGQKDKIRDMQKAINEARDQSFGGRVKRLTQGPELAGLFEVLNVPTAKLQEILSRPEFAGRKGSSAVIPDTIGGKGKKPKLTEKEKLEAERQRLELVFQYGEREAAIRTKIKKIRESGVKVEEDDIRATMEKIDRLKDMNDIYKGIGQTIKDGLVEGINAAIDGTKTLGEIANNVFRNISNQLISYGINAGLSNIPGLGKVFGKAAGGPVTGGSPYVVGEKGPELFVPGTSGNIVPNHAMGGANVVVNVDASGSSVEGDGGQAEELGGMLAAAVQAEIANQQRPGGLLAGTR